MMSDPPLAFICPACGGWHYGAILSQDLKSIVRYDCHSDGCRTKFILDPPKPVATK